MRFDFSLLLLLLSLPSAQVKLDRASSKSIPRLFADSRTKILIPVAEKHSVRAVESDLQTLMHVAMRGIDHRWRAMGLSRCLEQNGFRTIVQSSI